VKQAFQDVFIRRLGGRGQSKYHYCGVTWVQNRGLVFPDSNSSSKLVSDEFRGFKVGFRQLCQQIYTYYLHFNIVDAQEASTRFWRKWEVFIRGIASTAIAEYCQEVLACDAFVYDRVCEWLTDDVLRVVPTDDVLAIRSMAKEVEESVRTSMDGLPSELIEARIPVTRVFAQTLRRWTSLNHLANNVRPILVDDEQRLALKRDIEKLDLLAICEQASWVCECPSEMVVLCKLI
jgi:hypothetical protein